MSGSLFNPGPPEESTLPERQQLALRMVRETVGGCTSEQVGQIVHRTYGRRPCSCTNPDLPACQWASTTGTEVLSALRAKRYGLVRRQATGLWEIPGRTPKRAGEPVPGELPEGF